MRVILAMAISPNGLIARDNGQEDWLPSEGWDEFLVEAKRFKNIVMGRETYELVTKLYPNYNFDNVEADHKVIVTTQPDFDSPAGYHVVHTPEEAIDFVASNGLDQLLLLGGGKLNTSFIQKHLLDEIWLTITPYILGRGRSFISPAEFDLPLSLIEYKGLSRGRVLVKYRVGQSQ